MYKLAVVSLLLFNCTKKADQCMSNSDCADPAYPFCDVNGEFPASGGNHNVCTITPPDCPVETCGCVAGSATCGSDGTLTVCNADGMSVTTTTCSLGCELPAATCKEVAPSNGLGSALAGAGDAPAINIPDGATIDTDSGVVLDSNGQAIAAASTLVMQSSGIPIRVFAGVTVSLGDVNIAGADPVAFVSGGSMTVGNVNAAAYTAPGIGDAGSGGPGAVTVGDCVGHSLTITGPGAGGGGGGGNATMGGSGGAYKGTVAGGLAVAGFDLLVGGCSGGSVTDNPTLSDYYGGGGGGAIQLVSSGQMMINGVIDVGGGGGEEDSGGGAGGLVIIEAPTVVIAAAGGIAANGGGGGGVCNGANGPLGASAAPGGLGGSDTGCGSDIVDAGGAGGTPTSPPAPGELDEGPVNPPFFKGGGGGAVGRARIATLDGTYMSSPSSVLSVVITTDTLILQ